jgi:hypothetical protein
VIEWRKSSYSGSGNDDVCVEVARLPEAIGVRDSKDPDGGRLELGRGGFSDLVTRVKRGELDR